MNQHEYEALENEYLSHEARTLYVLCLRRYMDFSTGLVGTARRRISYQQFKEYLSVSRPRRSTKKPFIPSIQQLRGYVEELVKVGLVARMPKSRKHDHMIFRLPLATFDSDRLNEEQHMSNKGHQQVQQHEEEQSQGQERQTLNPQEEQTQQQEEQHQSNIEEQHTSVTSVINSHTDTRARDLADFDQRFSCDASGFTSSDQQPAVSGTGRKFAMHSDWQPDNTFTDQALMLGVDLRSLNEDQGECIEQALVEFRTWWMESQPYFTATQVLWQQKFIQTSLKRESNNQKGTHHGNSDQQNSGKHSGSAMSRAYTAGDFDLDATW